MGSAGPGLRFRTDRLRLHWDSRVYVLSSIRKRTLQLLVGSLAVLILLEAGALPAMAANPDVSQVADPTVATEPEPVATPAATEAPTEQPTLTPSPVAPEATT